MNTPNPLVPQGSLHHRKGASNVRLAVVTIVAIHVVFFGGLLLQGCKRDTKKIEGSNTSTESSAPTNALTYGSMPDTNLFYTNASSLPSDRTNGAGTSPAPNVETNASFAATELASTNRLGNISTPPGEGKDYIVAKGDSFFKIAKANGITVSALTKANPGVDSHKLKVGQKIKIPAAESPAGKNMAEASGAPGSTYTVKAGDTLTKIAKSHGITVSELRAANAMKTSGLKPGQKLKIPEKHEKTAAGSSTGGVAQPKQL